METLGSRHLVWTYGLGTYFLLPPLCRDSLQSLCQRCREMEYQGAPLQEVISYQQLPTTYYYHNFEQYLERSLETGRCYEQMNTMAAAILSIMNKRYQKTFFSFFKKKSL